MGNPTTKMLCTFPKVTKAVRGTAESRIQASCILDAWLPLLFFASEVLYQSLESPTTLRKYDVLQSYHKANRH